MSQIAYTYISELLLTWLCGKLFNNKSKCSSFFKRRRDEWINRWHRSKAGQWERWMRRGRSGENKIHQQRVRSTFKACSKCRGEKYIWCIWQIDDIIKPSCMCTSNCYMCLGFSFSLIYLYLEFLFVFSILRDKLILKWKQNHIKKKNNTLKNWWASAEIIAL